MKTLVLAKDDDDVAIEWLQHMSRICLVGSTEQKCKTAMQIWVLAMAMQLYQSHYYYTARALLLGLGYDSDNSGKYGAWRKYSGS